MADLLRPAGLTPQEADLSASAIEAFTVALGGRDQLLQALLVADGSPDVDQVTNLLLDPRYAGWSLRKLCEMAGLTVADLFAAYKKSLLVKAHLEATRIVVQQLSAVVADVMARAQPFTVICEACHGLGSQTPDPTPAAPNPTPAPCPACRGTGQVLQAPDLDRQKVALELGQLLVKSGGITLSQQTLVAPGASATVYGSGALDQLQQAVGEILTPRTRRPSGTPAPVDATIVEGDAHA